MKMVRCLTRAAVVLALCGMVTPPAAFADAPPAVTSDVALSPSGALAGVLVTPEGNPLDGAQLVMRRGDVEVARTATLKDGTFTVNGLSTGVYDLDVGEQTVQIRAWAANVAPPHARSQAVIPVGNAKRGQYGPSVMGLDIITIATLGGAVTGAVLGGISLSKINSIEDKVDKLGSP